MSDDRSEGTRTDVRLACAHVAAVIQTLPPPQACAVLVGVLASIMKRYRCDPFEGLAVAMTQYERFLDLPAASGDADHAVRDARQDRYAAMLRDQQG